MKKICYNSGDIEFFLGDCFLLAHPVHVHAKWYEIIFKCGKVIDILVRPLCDFRAEKRLRRNTAKERHWNNLMFYFKITVFYCDVWCFTVTLCARVVHRQLCASLQSQCEAFNSLIDWCLRQAVPDHLQRFSEFGDWFGLWMELVITFSIVPRHDSPWLRIWRPLIQCRSQESELGGAWWLRAK